jgi:membrane protein insertase Oxa1/YidC/SpoIIIJ
VIVIGLLDEKQGSDLMVNFVPFCSRIIASIILLSPSIITVPVESATNFTSALTERLIAVISVNLAVRLAILPLPSMQSLQEDKNNENIIAKKAPEKMIRFDI